MGILSHAYGVKQQLSHIPQCKVSYIHELNDIIKLYQISEWFKKYKRFII